MCSDWKEKYPRLNELREKAHNNGLTGFFDKIPQIVRNSQLASEVFTEIEQDLQVLDEDAWQYFQAEILSTQLTYDNNRGFSQVLARIFEAKGYAFLKHKGYSNIKFIPRQSGYNLAFAGKWNTEEHEG